jgi:hypothetical protein
MNCIEAPTYFNGPGPSLFLAGGITGTRNWQQDMIHLLAQSNWTILNPRRRQFPETPDAVKEQIQWEFDHLRSATARLFWFPAPTLCPIALFELGVWSHGSAPLFVGAHSEYQRRLDIQIQLSLARPEVTVVSTLDDLAAQATEFLTMRSRI